MIFLNRKAAVMGCLFLFVSFQIRAAAGEWSFDAATQKVYDLVLNLQTDQAHALLPEPETAQQHYVISLAEALELLVTEDREKYSDYEDRFEVLLERKTKLNAPEDLFLQAEIRMQWAFVYFKFGHEFDAALNLRQAYLTTQEIKKRFPSFQAINKTSALLEIIIGSVPEKYNWVLGLLNIQGSVELGLQQLESLRAANHPLRMEADILYALIQGYVLQQPGKGMEVIKQVIGQHPSNRLALFMGASLAIKNADSETALAYLTALDAGSTGVPLHIAEYLKGEVYLFKAEYLNSITSYRWFINHFKGENNIKDAYYKVGLCYWLNGNQSDARAVFKEAKSLGKEATEADKYAARSMAETELPHAKLTKARYYMDGGYFQEARTVLESIVPQELETSRDSVEFLYRSARLEDKTNHRDAARKLYQETIKLNGQASWYFAPNACLQLGYFAQEANDKAAAEEYFKQALTYKKHEYKNSIDAKAKSALAQLERK